MESWTVRMGAIAERFVKLAEGMPSSTDQADLLAAAKDFEALVEDRNGLMHDKPGTDSGHTLTNVNESADRF